MNISKKLLFLVSVLPIFCSVFAMEKVFQAQILKQSEKIGMVNGTTLLDALKGAALHSWSKKGKLQSNVNFPIYEISVRMKMLIRQKFIMLSISDQSLRIQSFLWMVKEKSYQFVLP